jgi:gliding motility-associated-like protein
MPFKIPAIAIAIFLLFSNVVVAQKKVASKQPTKYKTWISNPSANNAAKRLPGVALRTTSGDITYTGNPGFCPGGSIVLTAPAGTTYQWKRNGANISPNGTSATYTATIAGTYTVVVDNDESNPLAIVANPAPNPNFTFADNVCSGTDVQFTSSVTVGTPPFTYSWNFGDAGTSTAQNPAHAYTSLGCGTKTFNVTLTVTDANGCSSTTAAKVVTIKQAPDVSVADQNVFSAFNNCANTSTSPTYTLTVNNTSASCISSLSINWGDGIVQNGVTFPATHTYTQFGAYDLTVTGVGTNGCTGSKTYRIANQRNPDIGIATYGSTDSCAPLPVHIVITTWQNNSPGTTYLLNYGDGSSANFSHPINPTFTNDTITHTYTTSPCPAPKFQLKITATNACTDKSFQGGDIVIKTKPGVAFSAPLYACVNQNICFTNQTTPGYGANCTTTTLYNWDFGDGSTPGNIQSPCHTYTTPGTYNITLTGTSACGGNTITKQVCVTAAATSSFTIDNSNGCAPLTVNATNTSNTLTSCAPATYLWTVTYVATNCGTSTGYTFVNSTSSSSINPSLQFTNPGTYTITLSVTNVCGTVTSSKTVVVKKPPTVSIAGIPTICGINTITPTATVTNCGTTPETYLWSFPGGNPSTSTLASPGTITYSSSGTYTVTLAVTNECGTTTDTKTIINNPKPDINSPGNQSFCPNTIAGPFNIAGGLAGTTYSWTNSNTAIGLAAAGSSATIPTFTTTNAGVNSISGTINITATSASCTNTAAFTITVNPKPAKPAVVRPVSYCQLSTASPLSATAASGNTLTWFDNPQLTNGTTTAPTPLTTTVGSTTYYVNQTNTFNCTSDTAQITVTIVPAINGNSIAADQTLCSGSIPTPLTGSTPTGGTGAFIYQWQVSTDGGTTWTNVPGATGVNYSPGALTADTKYRRTVTSSTCTNTSNEVTIIIQGVLNNIGIAAAQTICAGTVPALLTGQLPTGGNGTFTYQWQSSPNNSTWTDIAGETQQDYQPPALTTNTYYRRKVSSGLCNTQSLSVLITVNQRPVINSIADKVDCNNSAISGINFTSTPNSNVTYTWTNDNINIGLAASGNGSSLPTFTASNANNPKQPISAGVVVIPTYTLNSVGCTGNADTFQITILPTITIQAIPNVNVCTGEIIPSVTPVNDAATFTGSNVSYAWNVTGAGTNLTSGTGTAIPSYTATNTGTTDLVTSITVTPKYTFAGKTCDGTAITYTLTVKPGTPPANAGPDRKLCAVTDFNMQAVISGTATGVWSQSAGSIVTIVNASSPTTQITGLAAGQTYQFVWTAAGFASCPTTTDTITVINRPTITPANAGVDTTICDFVNGGPNNTYTLPANLDLTRTYETGAWSFSGSSNGAVLSNLANPNATITFVNPGTYTLVWTISNDAGCTPSKDTVVIRVFAKPVAGTVSVTTSSICAGQSITVTASGFTGNISKWQYQLNNTSNWIDTAVTNTSITFNNVTDTFKVRVVIISSGAAFNCASAVFSLPVTISVAPPTIAGVTNTNATECLGNNTGTITLTGNNGVVVKWQSSTNSGGVWNDIANTGSTYTYNNLTLTTWFRAVVKSGTCADAFSGVTIITIVPAVTLPNAGPDQSLCNDTTIFLVANAPGSNESGTWSQISGPVVTFSSLTALTPTVRNVVPGTYRFKWTLTNNICPAKSDTVQVIVYPPLSNVIDTVRKTICSGQPITVSGSLATGGNGTYTYQWQQSTDNGATWGNIAGQTSASLTFLPPQNVWVRRVVVSGPCSSNGLVAILNVQPPLNNNNVASDQSICINTAPSSLIGSVPTGGDGQYFYQWEISTNGGATWTPISGATLKDYSPGVLIQTTMYRRLVSTALCSGSQGSTSTAITITVNPDAKAAYTFTTNKGCAPFKLDSILIKLQRFDDRVITYNWYANGVLIGSNSFPGYTILNSEDSVTIKLVAVSKFGCKNDSVEYKFYTAIKPQPAFSISDTVGCGPLTVSFINLTPRQQLFSYLWNFGNGITSTLPTPGTQTYQSNPTFFDTIYTVKLTTLSVCDTIDVIKTIRVKSKPKALFTPDKSVGCSPMTVNFNNTSHGNNVSYQWDFGDGVKINTNTVSIIPHTYTTAVLDTFYAKLIATNECGSDTQTFAIVVRPNAIKLDFAINGNQSSVCKPDTILFINNSSGATSFQWDFGDGNILTTTKNIDSIYHAYSKTGTFKVIVKATNGCSDTTSFEVLQVFAKPIVDFAATPLIACIGDTINFTNQSDTITGLTWHFGDGNTSNLINPRYKYNTPGTYNVRLIGVRQYLPGNACIDSTSKTVTVVSKLPGSFKVSDSISTCTPFTVTFTNNNIPSVLTVWDFGNNVRDTGNVVTHTFTIVGSYTVTMLAQHPGGCKYEATKTIVVNGPAGTFTYDNGVKCGSIPVRFEASVTGVDSIRWNFGDGQISTTPTTIIYHSYLLAGNYVPTATLITGNGGTCRLILKGVDTIKVDNVKAGFSSVITKECGISHVAFTDTSRAYSGVNAWQWKFGDNTTSIVKNPLHDYVTSNNWLIQLITTSKLGCTDTITRTVFVPVNSKPIASIAADSVVCTGKTTRFASSVSSQDSISLYFWNLSNGATSNASTFSQVFNSAGSFNATLIVSTINGCSDTTRKLFNVYTSPIVKTIDDKTICKGKSVQLSATGAPAYTWSPVNDLSCSTCGNPLATPFATTAYEVTGTNTFGCFNKDTVVVTVVQPFKMTVSPNDTICIGQSSQLKASGAIKYKWTPGINLNRDDIATPIATPTLTTPYMVVGSDTNNCFTDTGYVVVAVGQYPSVDLGPDKVLSTGTLLPLSTVVTNGPITKWLWAPAIDLSCSTCPLPVATVKKEITYRVAASNQYHCTGYDTINIKVFCESTQVFVPNLFTPDNDGVNDILMVRGTGIKTIKSFRIFNRWGELVFEKSNFSPNDKAFGWDGTVKGIKAPPDIYVYTCEVLCENDVPFVYKGNTAIIK